MVSLLALILRMDMKEKLQQIKTHVQKNKKIYIAAAAGVVVGGVAMYVATRTTEAIKVSNVAVANWKPQITNNTNIEAVLIPRGHRGNIIKCVETGELFGSQARAAEVLGVDPAGLSRHLSGKNPHVGGYTFENLGENLVSAAA